MASKGQRPAIPNRASQPGVNPGNSHVQMFHMEQSPIPSGQALDALAKHIPDVGERWMRIFESQIAHEQSIARDTLRVNEELNRKQLEIQEAQVKNDGRRMLLAQVFAWSLLVLGLCAFLACLGGAFWFYYQEKHMVGTFASGVAVVFGYFFRSVVKTYYPGTPPKK